MRATIHYAMIGLYLPVALCMTFFYNALRMHRVLVHEPQTQPQGLTPVEMAVVVKERFNHATANMNASLSSSASASSSNQYHKQLHQWLLSHEDTKDWTKVNQTMWQNLGEASNNNEIICQYFNFAVTGFAKCGTTTLAKWLGSHPHIVLPMRELSWIIRKQPLRAAQTIAQQYEQKTKEIHHTYSGGGGGGGGGGTMTTSMTKTTPDDSPASSDSRRLGYRFPHDLQWKPGPQFFRSTCPLTKHIVAIRHPVEWFESVYNYRIAQNEWHLFPPSFQFPSSSSASAATITADPSSELMGSTCNWDPALVCLDNGAFHVHLARLGKTPLNTPAEWNLLGMGMAKQQQQQQQEFRSQVEDFQIPNPIFLLDMSQLQHGNHLSRSLQTYLEVSKPMPAIPHENSRAKLKIRHNNEDTSNATSPFPPSPATNITTMDICDPTHQVIHDALVDMARNASQWIRTYFLASPDVYYSSEEQEEELVVALKTWMVDPCDARRRYVRTTQSIKSEAVETRRFVHKTRVR